MDDQSQGQGNGSTRVNPRSPREALQPEPAPAPPRASRRARNPIVVALNGILTFLLLIAIAGGAALYLGKQQFDSSGPLDQDRTVLINRGQDLQGIAGLLEREGIIGNAWLFMAGVFMNKQNANLKAGEYVFPAHASMASVMDVMVRGKAILHGVTIPEGYTSEQIVERLRKDPILVGEIKEIPAEGTLLPETFKFTRGTTRAQMIARMQKAHAKTVDEIWSRRADNLPVNSAQELVILASIVEKETGKADERPRVAGVFINRLRKPMRLQSDPTILYGLYKGKAFMQPRSITKSEKDAPNPYNTYQIDSLPPGPIANPGRAALEAVANPSRTDEFFFVADGTGGHIFSSTLDEHNRNVARWRQIERQRREKASKPAEEPAQETEAAQNEQAPAPAPGGTSLRGLNLNIPSSN